MTVTEIRVAGRYRLIRSLGVGGMGRVWLAHDEVLRREVAVKEIDLPTGLSDDEREELRLRTLREARAAARLSHPNVVQIFDVIPGEEKPWIVMEYVRARSLWQVIEEHGPLPVEQVARIGLAMLSALEAANRAGVLHRDIKPSNVLIAEDGRVVLTDFGSAILDDTEGAITKTGMILGSPQYIAPERAQEGISTPESDLWSLGATLYAAGEGRSPFIRPTVLGTLIAVATERPDPVQRATALKPVITGLLRKNPKARMSAFETERRLRRVAGLAEAQPVPVEHRPDPERVDLGSLKPVAAPRIDVMLPAPAPAGAPPAGRPRRLRWVAPAAAAVLVLAVVAVAAGTWQNSRARPRVAASAPATGATTGEGDTALPRSIAPPPQPLPANLAWWNDQSGFAVPMPAGWKTVREGPRAMFFCEPNGPRTLRVHAWDQLDPDPVAAMTREETRAKLTNYHRLRIQALPGGQGAEWEYTFTDEMGLLHGLERGFVVQGHAYLIQWRVPVPAWQAGTGDYTAIVNGFQPPRPVSKDGI